MRKHPPGSPRSGAVEAAASAPGSSVKPTLLRQREFALYWWSNLLRLLAGNIVAVAVGWQVYAIREKPFDLGLIGLAEFLPMLLLALPAGHLADRTSRRLTFAASAGVGVLDAAGLLAVTIAAPDQLWAFVTLAALGGAGITLGAPAARALPPELVAPDLLPNAMALRAIGSQVGTIAGPAVGGVLFAVSAEVVYATAIALLLVTFVAALALHRMGGWTPPRERAPGLAHVLGGIRFLRRSQIVLGAILLDLFAVLFGGAVALLPVFAKSILHTGPAGLGVLRAAPAVGALAAGVVLARRQSPGHTGAVLLVAVAVFGASMIVFGLSTSFPLSFAALLVGGAADMLSVQIRSTAVALATPQELRGRVGAVEMLFVSASNQLGAFESGLAAALLGTVPAVVAGGVATLAIVAVWPRFFPALARLDRIERLRPDIAAAEAAHL